VRKPVFLREFPKPKHNPHITKRLYELSDLKSIKLRSSGFQGIQPFVGAGLVPALSRATTRVAPTFSIAPRILKEPKIFNLRGYKNQIAILK
jgi:hypothetical protein